MTTRSRTRLLNCCPPAAGPASASTTEYTTGHNQNAADHYTLMEIKSEENENVKSEIGFFPSGDSTSISLQQSAQCIEEIQFVERREDDEPDDPHESDRKPKEVVEHVCGKCFQSFRRVKVLKCHMEFCLFSSAVASRREEMQKNIAKIEKEAPIMEQKDVCFCCGDSYDTCHSGHINCPDCSKTFKTQLSLERHIFLIHSENDDFPCTICNGRIRTAILQKLHIQQHMLRGRPFSCKVCGKDFTREYHLKRHTKYSQCGGQQVETMHCKVCGKQFYRLDNLRMHLKSHLDKEEKPAKYVCPCCKKAFNTLSILNIHIRTHTGERPFDCDICDKNFPSLISLKKHRRYHTGEKPYTCSVCLQSFVAKEVLNRHMKRHTGEKPHVCNECGKRFIQATQLKIHANTHLRPFECIACPEKFRTQKQLEKHAKQHCGKKKRASKHRCTDCNIEMSSRIALKRHEKTSRHIENARKVCDLCDEELPDTKSLLFHKLKEHESSDARNDGDNQTARIPQQHISSPHTIKNKEQMESVKEDNCTVIQGYIIKSISEADEDNQKTKTGDGDIEKPSTSSPPVSKSIKNEQKQESIENCEITENVNRLLDMLVDIDILLQFGWPTESVEHVLCKVIENCGHKLTKENFIEDYGTRMREYVKLLFTVVIQDDSIKELLNNYSIDEVIKTVLSNQDDDSDSQ